MAGSNIRWELPRDIKTLLVGNRKATNCPTQACLHGLVSRPSSVHENDAFLSANRVPSPRQSARSSTSFALRRPRPAQFPDLTAIRNGWETQRGRSLRTLSQISVRRITMLCRAEPFSQTMQPARPCGRVRIDTGYLIHSFSGEDTFLNPPELQLIRVISLPFEENTYIARIEGRNDCLVIDPGLEPEKILQKLDSLGLAPPPFSTPTDTAITSPATPRSNSAGPIVRWSSESATRRS